VEPTRWPCHDPKPTLVGAASPASANNPVAWAACAAWPPLRRGNPREPTLSPLPASRTPPDCAPWSPTPRRSAHLAHRGQCHHLRAQSPSPSRPAISATVAPASVQALGRGMVAAAAAGAGEAAVAAAPRQTLEPAPALPVELAQTASVVRPRAAAAAVAAAWRPAAA